MDPKKHMPVSSPVSRVIEKLAKVPFLPNNEILHGSRAGFCFVLKGVGVVSKNNSSVQFFVCFCFSFILPCLDAY